MDFEQMMAEFRARGWTDTNFGWLNGTQGQAFADTVEFTNGVLQAGHLSAAQKQQLLSQPSLSAAQTLYQQYTPAAAPAAAPAVPAAPPEPTPPPTTAPAPATPTTPTPEQQASAFASIRGSLGEMGLGGLAEWAWGRYQAGFSLDQIMLEMYQRPEFKAIYPEYEILAKKGRAYSVAELQYMRKQNVQTFRMYGIPEGFYDTVEELAAFNAAEISPAEMSKRVAGAAEAVYQASPLVRSEMERLYGVSTGDLIAYWLDPGKAEPIIRQNYTSAQIGAAARQTGYGTLTLDEAQRLGGLGVDQNQATQGFNTLAGAQELFNPLDSGENAIGREVQLGAAFGQDAGAQAEVEKRRSRRLAEFSEGGGFATNASGIVGVS